VSASARSGRPAPGPVDTYLRRVPKVDLHLHLEGAIRPDRLLAIRQRHALESPHCSTGELAWLYRHASFDEFLEHFRLAVASLRSVRDVHEVASDLFAELAAQNVVYAEVLFSAGIFVRAGLPWDELLAAASEAAAAAESRAAAAQGRRAPQAALHADRRAPCSPRYNLVIDLVRNFGPEFAVQQVEALLGAAHPRVVGVHLGGDEAAFPARLFAAAFRLAREAGLGCAAHAGEGAGAQSVREALRILEVARVGHGIRCLEDPEVVSELVARGTTLEVCPTSNARTKLVGDLAAHPLPRLLEHGLRVTLGSDDPSFFDTDITRELGVAHRVLGLDLQVLDALADNGIEAAFLPAAARQSRLDGLRAERGALRRELGLPPAAQS
jgi:adenosine deaminase